MRKLLLVFILTLCIVLPNTVKAEDVQVTLPALPAVVLLPEDRYDPILTPDNLKDNGPFILSRGGTIEQWEEEFKTKGIMLRAYDDSNKRMLVITGLQDEDARRFGDIDLQTAATRADYRREHQGDGSFANLGYRVESAEWKNFKNVGRFLMIKYSFREDGEVLHRGFARKAVKNGLTVMVDMQVFGRTLKAGDNTALNKVFDSLTLTGNVGEGVSMPVFLNESSTAPLETNKSSFTMKGMTRSGAKLTATVQSFSGTPANYTTEADAKGNYSLMIDLPGEGVYLLRLEVASEGLETLEKNYSINYGRTLLPVTFTGQLPEVLTQDKYTISGETEPGTEVQLIVNSQSVSKKSNNQGKFSFNVNTKEDGIYTVRLSLQKKGFNVRTFDFTATKGADTPGTEDSMTSPDGSTDTSAGNRGEALSPSYTDLIAKAESYDGKLLTYDGFITEVQQQAGEYVISMALREGPTGYADTVIAAAENNPGYALGSKVRVYGILEGMGAEGAESIEHSYPKLRVQNMVLLEEAAPAP